MKRIKAWCASGFGCLLLLGVAGSVFALDTKVADTSFSAGESPAPLGFDLYVPEGLWEQIPQKDLPEGLLGALLHRTIDAQISVFSAPTKDFDHPISAAMLMLMSMAGSGMTISSYKPMAGEDFAAIQFSGTDAEGGSCTGAVVARYGKVHPERILLFVGVWPDGLEEGKNKAFMRDLIDVASRSRLQ